MSTFSKLPRTQNFTAFNQMLKGLNLQENLPVQEILLNKVAELKMIFGTSYKIILKRVILQQKTTSK